MSRALLLIVLAVSVAGCATLDESQCRQADWYDLGYRDGQAVYPPARVEDHRQACAEYRIGVDDPAYHEGRAQGLDGYCTPESGYHRGRNGSAYQQVCPPHREQAFLYEYQRGLEIYQLENEIDELRGRIDREEAALSDPKLPDGRREDHRRELAMLYRELSSLRRQQDRLLAR